MSPYNVKQLANLDVGARQGPGAEGMLAAPHSLPMQGTTDTAADASPNAKRNTRGDGEDGSPNLLDLKAAWSY